MLNFNIGQVKLTFVGDSLAGKTCIIDAYITKKYNPSLVSTPCEYYTQDIEVNGKTYNSVLLDTSGLEDYDKLREHFHKNGQNQIARMAHDDKNHVKNKEGQKLAKKLKAAAFLECSAQEQINLDQVFVEAILSIPHTPQPNFSSLKSLKTCQGCVIS